MSRRASENTSAGINRYNQRSSITRSRLATRFPKSSTQRAQRKQEDHREIQKQEQIRKSKNSPFSLSLDFLSTLCAKAFDFFQPREAPMIDRPMPHRKNQAAARISDVQCMHFVALIGTALRQ